MQYYDNDVFLPFQIQGTIVKLEFYRLTVDNLNQLPRINLTYNNPWYPYTIDIIPDSSKEVEYEYNNDSKDIQNQHIYSVIIFY